MSITERGEKEELTHLENPTNENLMNHQSNPQQIKIEGLTNSFNIDQPIKITHEIINKNEDSVILRPIDEIIPIIDAISNSIQNFEFINTDPILTLDEISPNISTMIDKSKLDNIESADKKSNNDIINTIPIEEVSQTKQEKIIINKVQEVDCNEEIKENQLTTGTKKMEHPIIPSIPIVPIQKIKEPDGAEYYIKQAKNLKEKAKSYLENKQYNETISIYEYALRLIGPQHISPDDKKFKEAAALENSLLLSLSLCYSNLKNHDFSLKIAQNVLKSDPLNTNAMFRVSIEYKELGYIYRSFLIMRNCRLIKRKLEPNDPTDPIIEGEYKFLEEIVEPFLIESASLRRTISMKILGIKDIPVLEHNDLSNKSEIILPIEKEKKKEDNKLSKLKYGIYALSAGVLGSLATKYFLRYGLQKV